MEFSTAWYVLAMAFLLDLVAGDPEFLPHPIRWMGKAIAVAEPNFRKLPLKPVLSGALFALFLIFSAGGLTFFLLKAAQSIHPFLKTGLEMVLIYYCISINSLEKAAMEVYQPLMKKNLQAARKKLALIVGRDVEALSETGVARAAVETVAENLVDGVISPLLFAAIGGAPLAMAYKMINTLDSMVGYKNEAYRQFGKYSARIDDAANFIPARLSVPIISIAAQIISGNGFNAFKTAATEGSHHSSPNSGYSEAAFAGTIGIKLGGPNTYGGCLINKPYIGIRFKAPESLHIKKACDLMILSAFLWVAMLVISKIIV
ncbi:MAG: cobalamin biosynthesis protein CobD [Desulfobacterales bacterium]|nr:cobalamin biosynthesis protein CobD [Desulfobacterales bacterium]